MTALSLQNELGICFLDKTHLLAALTTKSYAKETMEKDSSRFVRDNERLEFLGDSVLELVVREFLFKNLNGREAVLSIEADDIVNGNNLTRVASRLRLKQYLRLGVGEANNIDDKMLSGAFEALIAAIYLDQGLFEAKKFILKHIIDSE